MRATAIKYGSYPAPPARRIPAPSAPMCSLAHAWMARPHAAGGHHAPFSPCSCPYGTPSAIHFTPSAPKPRCNLPANACITIPTPPASCRLTALDRRRILAHYSSKIPSSSSTSAAGAITDGLVNACALIKRSISSVRAGLFLRNSRTFSRPCPSRSSPR